jgi:hypothetical protein
MKKEEGRKRKKKEEQKEKKAKLVWILQKGTKLMQIKTETTKARKRRNEIAIGVLYSEADKRILLLFGS